MSVCVCVCVFIITNMDALFRLFKSLVYPPKPPDHLAMQNGFTSIFLFVSLFIFITSKIVKVGGGENQEK